MSNDLLRGLDPLSADPLLGLMAAFRQDTRPDKIDLGVGVYKNEMGQTPIMKAVARAQQDLANVAATKAYEGPRGNQGFCSGVEDLVFGRDDKWSSVSFATPGGCGALCVGMRLAQRVTQAPAVWLSVPTWPNHRGIAAAAGLEIRNYRYVEHGTMAPDIDVILSDLDGAHRGDVVVLQGPCHNPTGIDLSSESWTALAELCNAKGLLAFIDIAYHGLGNGLHEDMAGIRSFLRQVPTAMVSYSCSKTFGLYRDRAGCLIVQGPTTTSLNAAASHIADITRGLYSMPPAHGPALVEHIMATDTLRQMWQDELDDMRLRMNTVRAKVAKHIRANVGAEYAQNLLSTNGMFLVLPFIKSAVARLRSRHGIYIPQSGQINIAGFQEVGLADTIRIFGQYIEPK